MKQFLFHIELWKHGKALIINCIDWMWCLVLVENFNKIQQKRGLYPKPPFSSV